MTAIIAGIELAIKAAREALEAAARALAELERIKADVIARPTVTGTASDAEEEAMPHDAPASAPAAGPRGTP
jgi:hypothetical protein